MDYARPDPWYPIAIKYGYDKARFTTFIRINHRWGMPELINHIRAVIAKDHYDENHARADIQVSEPRVWWEQVVNTHFPFCTYVTENNIGGVLYFLRRQRNDIMEVEVDIVEDEPDAADLIDIP